MDFQIGEKVKWKQGKIECRGCFLEKKDDLMSIVIVHKVNDRFSGKEIDVLTEKLKLDI